MSKMSAHFPRITKHDLEVVVEAMDKLREALKVEEEAKPSKLHVDREALKQQIANAPDLEYDTAAPPSVDGLEAQCDVVAEKALRSVHSVNHSQLEYNVSSAFLDFIRARDRELVELAAKWDKENSLRSDDSYRYPQQLRAVLAARNEGGRK